MKKRTIIASLCFLVLGAAVAQRFGRWRWRGGGGGDTGMVETEGHVLVNADTVKTARETSSGSTGTPNWTNEQGFDKDVFSFVRIIYRRASNDSGISTTSSWRGWITDYPDSDLNLSYRIQQVTSLKVNPDGRVLHLTDPALFDYPWIYMVEPGGLELKEEEIPILRKYLLNGGALMADDFWGQKQWDNFERNIKRVLPEREFVELPMTHPIFHCVFDLNVPKNKLQTPNIEQGIRSLDPYDPDYGITWEYYHDDYDNGNEGYGWRRSRDARLNAGRAAHDMHVRAIFDDHGRIMVIATHNCDNGDSWEREGEDDGFFHEFSEKRGFPLGINIIFYLMTH